MVKPYEWAVRLAILSLIIGDAQGNTTAKVESTKVIHRGIHKRGLFYPVLLYPYNACSGILVAIAIPLAVPGRTVFLSYNFEANYNMPNQPKDSIPGPFNRIQGLVPENTKIDTKVDISPDEVILGRNLEKSINYPENVVKREANDIILLSRKGLYRVFESRISSQGFDGKKCLLLAICESSKHPLLESNGVLGHIIHIVLTPSSSMAEHLPSEYMKAEKMGQQSNCQKYESYCGLSVLNTFTKLF